MVHPLRVSCKEFPGTPMEAPLDRLFLVYDSNCDIIFLSKYSNCNEEIIERVDIP
jgi:hypothetical protein